jgi:hypothetical protein
MHEILGGNTDPSRNGVGTESHTLQARGYFKAWSAGARNVTVTPNAPGAAAAGSNAKPDPEVVITDAAGVGISGFPVRFSVAGGGGTLSDGTPNGTGTVVEVVTGARGKAHVRWTFGPAAGVNEIVAEGHQVNHSFRVTST